MKDRLAKAMEAKGWSQRELGRRLGITGSAISQRLGREKAFREWWKLYCMARELEVSTDAVLGLVPDEQQAAALSARKLLERSAEHLEETANRLRGLVADPNKRKRAR